MLILQPSKHTCTTLTIDNLADSRLIAVEKYQDARVMEVAKQRTSQNRRFCPLPKIIELGSLYQALIATREGLARSDSDYLLGRFSYADIAMAVVLKVVAPIATTQPPLGPATQACWNDSKLAAEFADLLEWRDRLAAQVATSYSQFKLELTL